MVSVVHLLSKLAEFVTNHNNIMMGGGLSFSSF